VLGGLACDRFLWRLPAIGTFNHQCWIFDNDNRLYSILIYQSRQEYNVLLASGQSREKLIQVNCAKYNLTAREVEIVNFIIKGLSYKLIGSTLNISEKTVAKHVSNIFGKVTVTNKVELIFKLEAVIAKG
jgi:DNA-binding NarL/FixJ family response regulator